MSTPLQVQANRRNSLLSTGPRTKSGKAMTARNTFKHGVHSWTPVLLPHESIADWEKFARAVVVDLQPRGPVEALWAGRIALLLWRLQRSMHARKTLADQLWREAVASVHATPWWQHRRLQNNRLPTSIDAARADLKSLTAQCSLLHKLLASTPDADTDINSVTAVGLIDYAAAHLHLDYELGEMLHHESYPGIGDLNDDLKPVDYIWKLFHIREALTQLAQLKTETFDQLIATLAPALTDARRLRKNELRRAYRE